MPKCSTFSFESNQNNDVEDKCNAVISLISDQESLMHHQQSSKLCARGHWKPAEDAKLKELVALHGPQNWNRIAEKLQGRSGNFSFLFLFSLEFVKVIKCKFVFFWIFYLQVRVAD